MGIVLRVIGILAGVFAALFVLSFLVYFFNLDMKLTSARLWPEGTGEKPWNRQAEEARSSGTGYSRTGK